MTVRDPSDLAQEINTADNVTRDLARKVADDVSAAIHRVLDVAPPGSLLPIAIAAGVSVMAALSICLDKDPKPEGPDPEALLFAGLLLGRMADRESKGKISSAYRDLAILKGAPQMRIKFLEIRDRNTFIPAIAIDLRPSGTNPNSDYLLRRGGYRETPRSILLTSLHGGGRAEHDPVKWGDRTFRVAHTFITERWEEIVAADVVDVEFILGETQAKATPERERDETKGATQ